ncbi:phosphatase PAP2 family protein [Fulvimarina sp. 2208YS6-2-32]|uniref:Phosphatase PAP2 family protein n=1 Tax=Fulvimarina uroteuthidis TaxID=3098149 RepID=A0ABU5I7V3_9HYPH|nr:phosphatase PAP2 family protein [Fulvimarina sp. 2208YS6-2-32]MDY8110964.1 phosphatase PAP2 family protein [Fulvimarina sp. 2208YS6-2-32]
MPTQFDLSLFPFIHGFAAETLAPFETGAADWLIALVPFVLIALWLRDRNGDRTDGATAAIAAGMALALSGLISFLVFEPRPFMIGLAGNVLDHAADSSFPSDHVAVMAAVTASLTFAGRSRIAAILATATVFVGWSRVALGVHFPTDVVAGASIGVCAAGFLRSGLLSPFVAFVVRVGETVSAMMGLDKVSDFIRKPSFLRSR